MSLPDLPLPTPGQRHWAEPLNASLEALNDALESIPTDAELEAAVTATETARDQAQTYAANTQELQDAAVAGLITDPDSETATQLSATIDGRTRDTEGRSIQAMPVAAVPRVASRAPVRTGAWSLNDGSRGTADANMTGIVSANGVLSALTPGTEGRVWAPLFNANRSCRMSATVLATKDTAGSYSLFGVANSALGTAPSASVETLCAGYVQGVGIVLRRAPHTGFDQVLVADTAITDGETYRVSFAFDNELRAAGAPNNPFWYASVHDEAGRLVAFKSQYNASGFTNMGMLVARTTVANGLADLRMGQSLADAIDTPVFLNAVKYTALSASEQATLRIPGRPNGLLVVVLHGRGSNDTLISQSVQFEASWRLLLDAGYTLFMPNMGGNRWFDPVARSYIVDGVGRVCAALNLDRTRVFLWGDSMGGGTALALVGNNDLGTGNVAAVYAAEPVCDIDNVYSQNSSNFTEIPELYPTKADRDAASPLNLPTENYAGVPIVFLASPADVVVPKAANTDAMRSKLGTVTKHVLYPTTGAHAGNSHYNAAAALGWFSYAGIA